jgi:hypothetical protein
MFGTSHILPCSVSPEKVNVFMSSGKRRGCDGVAHLQSLVSPLNEGTIAGLAPSAQYSQFEFPAKDIFSQGVRMVDGTGGLIRPHTGPNLINGGRDVSRRQLGLGTHNRDSNKSRNCASTASPQGLSSITLPVSLGLGRNSRRLVTPMLPCSNQGQKLPVHLHTADWTRKRLQL